MMGSFPQGIATGVVVAAAGLGCGSSGTIPMATGSGVQPIEPSDAPLVYETQRLPHTPADVRFMSGMISHHAQAVLIAGWAASHGASAAVGRLSERIVVGQRDEITLMQNWLRDVGAPVPEGDPADTMTEMSDASHHEMMPGMLTAEELTRLDAARGPAFDRLFLTYMIRHHEGALVMVDELFGSYGAGQNETVFQFASNVYSDQSTEIDRMQRMLAELTAGGADRAAVRPSPRF